MAQWPRADALAVAKIFCAALKPVTTRLCVAGSLRRRKEAVGDVEILFVPRCTERPAVGDMFAKASVDMAAEIIEGLLAAGEITKRLSVDNKITWGPKNKLALHKSGIPVDLFATTEEYWWVALVIRTGSKDTNLRLTTGAQKLGRKLNAYGTGVTCSDGQIIAATSEQHVFELCGVPYREPWERNS